MKYGFVRTALLESDDHLKATKRFTYISFIVRFVTREQKAESVKKVAAEMRLSTGRSIRLLKTDQTLLRRL